MPLANALHILRDTASKRCSGGAATPGMPMSTPFILSASSRDLELKGISTARIPDYVGDDPGLRGWW
jgi:hypothetical protein